MNKKNFPESLGFVSDGYEWTKPLDGGYMVITESLLDSDLYSFSFVDEDDNEIFIFMKGTREDCVEQMKIFQRDEKIRRLLDFDQKTNIKR